jgi:hypothetical protein
MFRSKRTDKAGAAAAAALDHAQHAAAHAKPLASSARAAARRGLHSARAFAAPQVERVAKHIAAPKVSAMLSSAAQRLEPVEPRGRRWRKLTGISLLTVAASAAAALACNRAKQDLTPGDETDTDNPAPAAEMRAEKASTSADADVEMDGQVRTS